MTNIDPGIFTDPSIIIDTIHLESVKKHTGAENWKAKLNLVSEYKELPAPFKLKPTLGQNSFEYSITIPEKDFMRVCAYLIEIHKINTQYNIAELSESAKRKETWMRLLKTAENYAAGRTKSLSYKGENTNPPEPVKINTKTQAPTLKRRPKP